MTYPDGISAIGASPLGTMGLNYSGVYGSYADPMMMGMSAMSGLGSMGQMGMMSPMGMMGMYNPAFMQQYIDTTHNIERSQVSHSADMHEALMNAEVANLSAHDRAIFQKISVDGDVQRGIRILADAVRRGDSDSIIEEYDRLKSVIYLKHADLFKQNKSGNAGLNADRYIEIMYAQIVSKQTGDIADLRTDIKRYGETAFMNGFNRTFLGNSDHNKKYSEEVLSYIDGNTRINDKGSKDRAQKWGAISAKIAEGATALGAGFATGWGLLAFAKTIPGVKISFFKNAKAAGWLGAAALLAGDIIWQMSRSESNA